MEKLEKIVICPLIWSYMYILRYWKNKDIVCKQILSDVLCSNLKEHTHQKVDHIYQRGISILQIYIVKTKKQDDIKTKF